MSFFIVGRKFFGHQRNFLVLRVPVQGGLEDFTFDPRSTTHFDSREEAEAVVSALMLRPERVDGQGYEVIERRPKLPAPHQEQPTPKGQGPVVLPVLLAALDAQRDPRTTEGQRWGRLYEEVKARVEIGVARYGEPLRAHNGRDALRDAREEGLDRLLYLTQAYIERRMSRAHWLYLVKVEARSLLDAEPEALGLSLQEAEWAVQRAEEDLVAARQGVEALQARADKPSAADWAQAWAALAEAEYEMERAKGDVAGFFASEDHNGQREVSDV